MEYEVFEPDPEDEYYDQMCAAAYAAMFNSGRSDNYAENYNGHPVPVDRDFCNS